MNVQQLFEVRGLDTDRFHNLMMSQKSVNLPNEDAITNGVNASRPIVASLTDEAKSNIEAVIVGTESGLDYGKAISTYIHQYLGLSRYCRSFEIKHACYGGTAALQTAVGMLLANSNPDAKILVIATDAASTAARNTYWEPSQGAGAIAMLLSRTPHVLALDLGANGYYSYEVMDTCRPQTDLEAGDSDLSLLSYLQCLEKSYSSYCEKVNTSDFSDTFDYLVFHTPFAGMVKGAHRHLSRKLKKHSTEEIEKDFVERMIQSLHYCRRVGNIYSASLYLALCSFIDNAAVNDNKRIGMFSYGSGCASEFYSGVVGPEAKKALEQFGISNAIDQRRLLTMEEYETIVDLAMSFRAGVKDKKVDPEAFATTYSSCFDGNELLVLDRIENYHRKYAWS